MIVDISIIEWNDMETLPEEHKPVLLLWFDDKYNEIHVSSAMYDKYDKGFIDSDAFDIPRVFDNALAWAEYPTIGIVLNHLKKNQAYISRPL